MSDDETIAQALHRRVTEAMKRGASPDEIKQEIAWAQEAMNAKSASDPERQRTAGQTAATIGEAAGDAASFGLTGIASDAIDAALGRGSFRENRDLRKQEQEQVRGEHPWLMGGAEVAGSLINPANRLLGPVKKGAGFLRTVGKALAEGGTQAALQSAGTNVGTTDDPTGLGNVLPAAAVGAGAGGAMGVVGRAIPVARTAVKALRAQPLDEAAIALRDAIRTADAANYGKVAQEAAQAGGTSPALQQAMAHPDLAKFVKLVKSSRQYRNADDATQAQVVYKLLSDVQRRLGKQVEGSPSHLAGVELKKGDIPLMKDLLVSGATAPNIPNVPGIPQSMVIPQPAVMPSWPKAIAEHANLKGQQDAFNRGADMAERVIAGTDLAANKLLKNSPAVYKEEIGKMTREQAEAALKGVLARIKDVPEVTSNPVGKFGIVSSTARSIMAPSRLRPIVEALEARAGKAPPSQMVANMGPGLAGRLSEMLMSNIPE